MGLAFHRFPQAILWPDSETGAGFYPGTGPVSNFRGYEMEPVMLEPVRGEGLNGPLKAFGGGGSEKVGRGPYRA